MNDTKGGSMRSSHAVFLGASLVIAALVFGVFFYSARTANDGVTVTGAASVRFDSDIVKWRITISRNTGFDDVANGYVLIQNDLNLLKKALVDKGLSEIDITVQPINTMPTWGREGMQSGYTVQQSIYVITSNIAAVDELALNPTVFVERGIVLQNSSLEFFSSNLSDIKMQLLAEATKDAQKRASEIATNSGVKLGKVSSLRAGVFQITEPFSNEVSDYGMYSTQTKQKDINVTVRAEFRIK
jgi:hypothetical protein